CLMRYAYQAYGVIQHIPVGWIRRSRRIRQDKAHQFNNLGQFSDGNCPFLHYLSPKIGPTNSSLI
ncbi:hypothetical protein, partial [Escherichia coli]